MPIDDVPAGFTIIKPIASGGSGRVYLAQQQSLGVAGVTVRSFQAP